MAEDKQVTGHQPASSATRLDLVDALRGFALLGLFLVHMVEAFELHWAHPKPDAVTDTVFLLFMGKSFSLLALCFGFSFFVMMDRAARRGGDFTRRFVWRLLLLEAIGWLHAIVYRGDIIQLLAGMGLLLLIADKIRSNRILLAIAGLCFLSLPLVVRLWTAAHGAEWANAPPHFYQDAAMPVYLSGSLSDVLRINLGEGQAPKWWFYLESGRIDQILGLFITGLVLGRIGFFARPQEFVRARAIGLAVAAAAALILYFSRAPLLTAATAAGYPEGTTRVLDMLLSSYRDLAGTVVWALLIVALWQMGTRRLLLPLAAMGRLTLTLYIGQSLLFVPVFYGYGLGLHDDLSGAEKLALAMVAAALMMIAARLWLARFQYGPLEWVWRAGTFLSTDVPFRLRPRRA